MSNEPNDTVLVDANTDDLDAFTELFNGKVKAEAKEEPKDNVENDEVDTVAETENETQEAKTEDDPDEDKEPKEEPEEKPKKVNRFQERINELTAKAREAERREADLQRKLEEFAAKQNNLDPKIAAQTEAIKLPNPDTKNEDGSDKYPLGEFDPAYIRDLNRAIIEDERKSIRQQEEQDRTARQTQEARDNLQTQWAEKLTPMTEQHDDFLEKTLQLETAFDGIDANYSDYLVQTIKSLDHGPEVLYYFANNLEEAKKVVQSGPLGATLMLGELNAMFKGQGRKETKVSKAPPPPQVNTKGTSVKRVISGDTDDLDAFSDVFFPRKKR